MTEMALQTLSANIGNRLKMLGKTLTCAESCTGGWVAKAITDIAGSSAYFERGFVTYSNEAKSELLGVDPYLLETAGAVSEAVVQGMAQGALSAAKADFAVSISGIAGPEGGSKEKPVGTVWFGFSSAGGYQACYRRQFSGDRMAIRLQATVFALQTLYDDFLSK